MKNYLVVVGLVERVWSTEEFVVEAENETEAIALVEKNSGGYISYHCESNDGEILEREIIEAQEIIEQEVSK